MTNGHLCPDLVQLLQIAILPQDLDGLVKDSDDPAGMRSEASVSLKEKPSKNKSPI